MTAVVIPAYLTLREHEVVLILRSVVKMSGAEKWGFRKSAAFRSPFPRRPGGPQWKESPSFGLSSDGHGRIRRFNQNLLLFFLRQVRA